MNATKKTTRPTRKATTRKATTRTATTRSTTRRTTPRRAKPKVATTIGAGLATLAVAAFVGASWPVRIGLVVLALVLVGGYLLVQGRRHDAAEAATPPAAPSVEAVAPPADPTPPTPPRPEEPA